MDTHAGITNLGGMTTTAIAIAVTYSIAVVAGSWIAIGIWRSTREGRKPLDAVKAAERETAWLGTVIAFLVATLIGTMLLVPYGNSAGPNGQVVDVVARQFAFTLKPDTVKAGIPVEFHLHSEDTTHGFGITTQDNNLLFQVQIPPEHVQHGVYTFKKPGTYKIVCYEFCGVDHHGMLGQIEVTQ